MKLAPLWLGRDIIRRFGGGRPTVARQRQLVRLSLETLDRRQAPTETLRAFGMLAVPPASVAPGQVHSPVLLASSAVFSTFPQGLDRDQLPRRALITFAGAGLACLRLAIGAFLLTSVAVARDPGKTVAQQDGVRQLKLQGSIVRSIAFSPSGSSLATAGADGVVRLWDAATYKEVQRFTPHQLGVSCITFSADGKLLISGGAHGDSTIRLWDTATAKEVGSLGQHGHGITSIAVSPDGSLLASAADGEVFLWDLSKRKRIRVWSVRSAVDCVAFSPDGIVLASGCGDGMLYLWKVGNGKELRRLKGHRRPIRCIAFSPNGKMLGSGGEGDGTISIWEIATGKRRGQLQRNGDVILSIAFSADSRTLASATSDALSLWDIRSTKVLRQWHSNGIRAVAFSPAGKTLAAGADVTVLIIDLSAFLNGPGARPTAVVKPRELDFLWDQLGSEDATCAFHALWALADAGDRALPFVEGRLQPVPAVDPRLMKRLVADLDSEQFDVREKATAKLEKLGGTIRLPLHDALRREVSSEARRRLEFLLEQADRAPASPEKLRLLRAIELLEFVGSQKAQQILKALGNGAPGAPETEEAKRALRRISK